jgi:UDP-N-acetylmuramoyl-tripeptide--D-alanyl-D-alanine ligase
MLTKIFPLRFYLHIAQLEDYDVYRFVSWLSKNPFKHTSDNKKPLVWTSKVKTLFITTLIYIGILSVLLVIRFGLIGLVISLILATQTYIFLVLSLLTRKPYEILNRALTKKRISNKIAMLKKNKLKVIGITGSYGKTSVKEFLYHILKSKYKVLRTPESYNTLFGIEKVVTYELDETYDYFICEMGAYKIGEIDELCSMVLPGDAILTAINEQHLERFGKIENTIQAKFELIQWVEKSGMCLLNATNTYINENYSKYTLNPIFYGTNQCKFHTANEVTTLDGTRFSLILDSNEYEAETKLIGYSNIQNILAASSFAYLLGVGPETIVKAISNLKAIPHRLELKKLANGLIIIDDAYSSNIDGFKEALKLLATFNNHQKVIVTPGIVELGKITYAIHKELGAYVDQSCDKILLVGKSDRTRGLEDGISVKNKIHYLNSIKELYDHIDNIENTVLLIENDLPDNY